MTKNQSFIRDMLIKGHSDQGTQRSKVIFDSKGRSDQGRNNIAPRISAVAFV
jgi:hypothetical protein